MVQPVELKHFWRCATGFVQCNKRLPGLVQSGGILANRVDGIRAFAGKNCSCWSLVLTCCSCSQGLRWFVGSGLAPPGRSQSPGLQRNVPSAACCRWLTYGVSPTVNLALDTAISGGQAAANNCQLCRRRSSIRRGGIPPSLKVGWVLNLW